MAKKESREVVHAKMVAAIREMLPKLTVVLENEATKVRADLEWEQIGMVQIIGTLLYNALQVAAQLPTKEAKPVEPPVVNEAKPGEFETWFAAAKAFAFDGFKIAPEKIDLAQTDFAKYFNEGMDSIGAVYQALIEGK